MYCDHSGRAHLHHVRLRPLVPAPASFACELLANLVPQVLRVDDDAVEVEHDGFDTAHTRHVVAADLARRGDAGESHGEVEVRAEVADDAPNAVLAARSQTPHVGPPEPDRRGAERQGPENVRAGENAAVENRGHTPRDGLDDPRQRVHCRECAVHLPPPVIRDHDAAHAVLDRRDRVPGCRTPFSRIGSRVRSRRNARSSHESDDRDTSPRTA